MTRRLRGTRSQGWNIIIGVPEPATPRADLGGSAWRQRTAHQFVIGRALLGVPLVTALAVAGVRGELHLHAGVLIVVAVAGAALGDRLLRLAMHPEGRHPWAGLVVAATDALTLYVVTAAWDGLVVPALFLYAVSAVFHAAASGFVGGATVVAMAVLGTLTHADELAASDLGQPLPALVLLVSTLVAAWMASSFKRTVVELSGDLRAARARHEQLARDAANAREVADREAHLARRRSDALDRARDELLRTASHELRTPLTAIAGALEVLDERIDGLSPARIRSLVSIARHSAADLGHVTEQVLDLVRLADEADDGLRSQPFDLLEVFQHGYARVEHLMGGRLVTLDADVDTLAVGDARATARVVENVLSNVVHHTPEGTPAHVRIGRVDGHALLEVRDQGHGIPDSSIGVLVRGEHATERSRGLGIGLALCDRFARAQGGRFEVSGSEAGTVARLWLTPVPSEAGGKRRQTGAELHDTVR